MKKKTRTDIPKDLAARVLFFSDRTCCLCRLPGKPIQIHHIDENPSNNIFTNLAVLCLDCHNETMVKGGFGRKLDADQVILYRDDWINIVAQTRTNNRLQKNVKKATDDSYYLKYATSIAEIYRENKQHELLAMHYSIIGNNELRDKYIDMALEEEPLDSTICYLRSLQGRQDIIPKEVIQRELNRHTKNKDWSQRARLHVELSNHKEAVQDYLTSIQEDLTEQNFFSAAFYLKELVEENLIEELFKLALKQSIEEDDLWWQIRALEELEWYSEIDDLVLRNSKKIEESEDEMLLIKLERARKNMDKVLELDIQLAKRTRVNHREE